MARALQIPNQVFFLQTHKACVTSACNDSYPRFPLMENVSLMKPLFCHWLVGSVAFKPLPNDPTSNWPEQACYLLSDHFLDLFPLLNDDPTPTVLPTLTCIDFVWLCLMGWCCSHTHTVLSTLFSCCENCSNLHLKLPKITYFWGCMSKWL